MVINAKGGVPIAEWNKMRNAECKLRNAFKCERRSANCGMFLTMKGALPLNAKCEIGKFAFHTLDHFFISHSAFRLPHFLMVVTIWPMHMAVSQFFCCGRANVDNFTDKM